MLYLSSIDYRNDASEIKGAYELDNTEKKKREMRIKKEAGNAPILVIVTCTRIECYSLERPVPFETIERAFSLSHIKSMDKRIRKEESEALYHFYKLSLGLDSPLFGEELILSQIKEAEVRAIEQMTSSSFLLRLSNDVIAFSKAMHSKYKIRVFDDEIAYETLNLVKDCDSVLIIGSGELSRMVSSVLIKANIRVTMSLRDMEKTFLLVPGAKAISYDERHERVKDFDAIISSSSGIYYTLSDEDKEMLNGKILIDLASPYDIPPSLNPIRLEDMNVKTPKRDEVVRKLENEIEKRIKEFLTNVEMKEEAMKAEDFSISLLRRINSVIDSLALEVEKRKNLESAIYESARKAYIEKERKARKQ